MLASAQSSRLSASLRLNVSWASGSAKFGHNSNASYGSLASAGPNWSADLRNAPTNSSLLDRIRRTLHLDERRSDCSAQKLVGTNCTINNCIYDSISFAESPLLRSLSYKERYDEQGPRQQSSHSSSLNGSKHHDESSGNCWKLFENKFRFFLSCYLLLGITLANYSRNALSLAAVGMIASNAFNKELADQISMGATSGQALGEHDSSGWQLDGACQVMQSQPFHSTLAPLPLGQTNGSREQLEAQLRGSIDLRVARAELVDWTPGEQGLIFAAGRVGNLLIAIPLTRLGELYGPKWIIFLATLGATIQAALMPAISPCNIVLVIIFQIIFNGLTYGADCVAYTLFAHWLAPTEMAFFVSCLLICYQMGTILSSFATAKILSANVAWSWCFYTPGKLED